jgi:3-methylfumaryl-CoA hydratase
VSAIDLATMLPWQGRQERRVAVLDPWPAAALTAALGRDDPPEVGAPLPPFWHQLHHLPVVHADATGPDGHARKEVALWATGADGRLAMRAEASLAGP